jgi:peroxiredoxin Q/BCP
MSPLPLDTPAPDFTLPGWGPDGERDYRLAEMSGRPLVLAFYPGDDTPVCTRQLCSYEKSMPDLDAVGATVWGISTQDVASHQRFAEKHGLSMPLLADVDGAVHRAYGLGGVLNRRALFVIDGSGRVAWSEASLTSLRYVPAERITEQVRRLGPEVGAPRD